MESDLAALPGLKTQVVSRVLELNNPEPNIERVRLASFFDGGLDSQEAVETAVENLKSHLMKLVAEGARIVLE